GDGSRWRLQTSKISVNLRSSTGADLRLVSLVGANAAESHTRQPHRTSEEHTTQPVVTHRRLQTAV
ncbi:MAG: hypothetical protein KY476_27065, partial [Planctomycetes bacterium]|nr:hypothetical protein [Planctomycetota bacterium]